jgi:hypothetical protein
VQAPRSASPQKLGLTDKPLTRSERTFLADFLDGRWKRPKQAPNVNPQLRQTAFIVIETLMKCGWQEKEAVEKAAGMLSIETGRRISTKTCRRWRHDAKKFQEQQRRRLAETEATEAVAAEGEQDPADRVWDTIEMIRRTQ